MKVVQIRKRCRDKFMRRGFAPIIAIAIVAAFLIGIGATVGYLKLKSKSTSQTQQTTPKASPESNSNTSWNVYTNPSFDFSFKYPSNYIKKEIVREGKITDVQFTSTDYSYETGVEDGYTKSGGKITIGEYEEKISLIKPVLAEFVPKILFREKTTIDGIEANLIIAENLGEEKSHNISLTRNGKKVLLSAYYAGTDEQRILKDFDQILSTFQFTN